MIPYSAIILAGAFSERLQADKALADLGGKTLLQHVLDAVDDAASITVVGPERAIPNLVTWCQEEPAGGGPVAAFAAGLSFATTETV
ncbi:MAG TPA: NTP transferase domain-containing protein, partial [Marmoricola sp.]|nr:NTP transferase domain-containing protein [Marmoricola sp.]